jgi:F-box protein 18 (helicase)
MKWTKEQEGIFNSTGNILINAVAGSGKTTTLIEYAKGRPGARILYIAFNKSVKIEAEFKFSTNNLRNVTIETAHSLAFKHIVMQSNYKIKQGDYKPYELVALLGMTGSLVNHELYIIANHIQKLASYFCNSAVAKVQELDYLSTIIDTKAKAFVKLNYKYIERYAREFLAKMNNAEIEITHDFYLKKFQLSNPILTYDYILFDEGQDASPAMLEVFMNQKATKVIVGDTHQQIYSWRYAINSLEQVKFQSFDLSTSFRFGPKLATLSNLVLHYKTKWNATPINEVKGIGHFTESKTKAIIGRTNLGLLVKAINFITDNRNVKHIYFEGNFSSYTYADEGASLYDILNLYNKKHFLIRDELIKSMNSIIELDDYIEKTEDKQLQMMLEIVKEYDNQIPSLIKKIKDLHVVDSDKHKADIVFSTVHRCKGMEYDIVELANDFITEEKIDKLMKSDEFKTQKHRITEEVNLLYVAITRAKSLLKIPEELLPKGFQVDSTIQLVLKPTIAVKKDIVLTDYSSRMKKPDVLLTDSYYSKSRERNPSAYQPWTREMDRELEHMFDIGKTFQEMADTFERTKGAIIARLKRIGILES